MRCLTFIWKRVKGTKAAVAALAGPPQLVGVNDALGGVMAQRQIKFFNEPARAQARGFLAECHPLVLQGDFGFVGAGFGSTALRAQAGVTLVAVTAGPFSDGVTEAAEVSGGCFDAFGPGELDEWMTQGKMGIVSANHVGVRFVGGRRITGFIYHALVSPEVRHRCPSFSIFLVEKLFARSLASPETAAARPLTRSKCVERYIEFSSAGKPAEGGHDVPGPRRPADALRLDHVVLWASFEPTRMWWRA